MNEQKAIRKIRRKISRAKPCPFCGRVPGFSYRANREVLWPSSFGHHFNRERCCAMTYFGGNEIFFRNDHRPPDFGQWWRMICRHIDNWNKREERRSYVPTAKDERLNKRILAAAKLYTEGIGSMQLAAIYRYHQRNENARTKTVIYYHA